MDEINRRNFLKIVGVGSGAVAAGAVVPTLGMPRWTGNDALSFRAVAGLPAEPLPAYASYVLEGSVNLASRTGLVSRTVLAGAPDAMSDIALPGLSQTIRVTDVRPAGGALRIQGIVSDRFQVRRGESPTVEILVDRLRGIVRAPFFGSIVTLNLRS